MQKQQEDFPSTTCGFQFLSIFSHTLQVKLPKSYWCSLFPLSTSHFKFQTLVSAFPTISLKCSHHVTNDFLLAKYKENFLEFILTLSKLIIDQSILLDIFSNFSIYDPKLSWISVYLSIHSLLSFLQCPFLLLISQTLIFLRVLCGFPTIHHSWLKSFIL